MIDNICACFRGARHMSGPFLVPLAVPAGTRLAARAQATGGTRTLNIQAVVMGGGFAQSPPLGKVTTYGANTADSGGVSVDPGGVAHTKGAWSEITAATADQISWLVMGVGNQANSARTQCEWLVDIGVGAAGSEQVLIGDLLIGCPNASEALLPGLTMLPIKVPAGTRLAVRAQCSIIDATDRTFDTILYGVS